MSLCIIPQRERFRHARCHCSKQKEEVSPTNKPSSLSPRSPPAPLLSCVAPRNLLAHTLFTLLRLIQPTPKDPKRSPLNASCCPSRGVEPESLRLPLAASRLFSYYPPDCPACLFVFSSKFSSPSDLALHLFSDFILAWFHLICPLLLYLLRPWASSLACLRLLFLVSCRVCLHSLIP